MGRVDRPNAGDAQRSESESCGCAASEKVISLLKKQIILLEGMVETLKAEVENYCKEKKRKHKKV